MKTISASEFKAKCLKILDRIGPEGVIITKRGKPIARVLPVKREFKDYIGTLRGKLRIRGDIMSTGIKWDAES